MAGKGTTTEIGYAKRLFGDIIDVMEWMICERGRVLLEVISKNAVRALELLLDNAGLEEGDCVVIGCSTSEIAGHSIGTGEAFDIAAPLAEAFIKTLSARGLNIAAQCCEHLNRALVVSRKYARAERLQQVWAVPRNKAGGAFSVAVYRALGDAVLVDSVRAGAGMDIGQTLIGMHLRPVVVPFRCEIGRVGGAILTMARVRPPMIGGERAQYLREDGVSPY